MAVRMADKTKDLELILSEPRKAMIHMAVPLFFSFLVATLQTYIDALWCSGLGPDPLSAISIVSPILRIITMFGLAFGVGASAAIARALGADDKPKADRIATQSVMVTLVAVFGVMPLMYAVGGPLIAISGGGYNIELSMEYMMPYIFCTLPIMMNGLFIGLIRSEGAARKSMAISVSASVLNMVLDPILIYVLDMGIVGASWATCISFIIPTIAAILLYVRMMMYVEISLAGFRFDKALLREIAVIAVPYTAEMLLVSLMTVPEQGVVASCGGPEGLVIYTNAFYYVMLVTIPTQAFCAALLPVVSAQIGQKGPGKIRESISFSLKIVVGIGLVMSVFLFLAADILADIYTYAEEMKPLHDEMAMAIRIYSAVPAVLGVMRVWTAVLQALRRAFLSSFLMFFREVVFLCAYIVASTISMTAIYWSVDLTNVVMCVIMAMIGMTVLKDNLGKMTKDPGL